MLSLFFLSSCHVGRFFVWNFADINDYKKFPADTIRKAKDTFHFYECDSNIHLEIPRKYANKISEFGQFIEKRKTLALLIIRNDSILYENYFDGYIKEKIHPSFSLSKAYISALTGIAVDEGYIKNTQQPITDYIKDLKDCNLKKVTIENLLNMRSGIKFTETYTNPFGKTPKYYYGRNLKKYTLSVKLKSEPGEKYEYQSVNSQLLCYVIEDATGHPITEYLEKKLWQPLGMEYEASWNYDSKKHKSTKAFCCLNARARDYAKFGRLYLNKGKWGDHQIISPEWIERSTSVINDSEDSQGYHYSYCWRVSDNGTYFAKGFLGQYIWVNPKKNIIIVRLGKSYSKIDWADFFQCLSNQL